MKGIKIDDRLLVRESMRMVDRNNNQLNIVLQIDPLLNTTYTINSLNELTQQISISITKEKNAELWNILKDSGSEIFIDYLFKILLDWKVVCKSKEPEAIIENIEDPTNGVLEVVIGFEKESEEYTKKRNFQENYSEYYSLFVATEKYDFEMMDI